MRLPYASSCQSSCQSAKDIRMDMKGIDSHAIIKATERTDLSSFEGMRTNYTVIPHNEAHGPGKEEGRGAEG